MRWNMLEMAERDLETANILLENFRKTNNERLFNNICYHIQQCIEKSIKGMIDAMDVEFLFTHSFYDLSEQAIALYKDINDSGHILEILHDMMEKSVVYTPWESSTRYHDGFRSTINNIRMGISDCERCIEACKMCGNLMNK